MIEAVAQKTWTAPLHLDCVVFDGPDVVVAAYEYVESENKRLGALYKVDMDLNLVGRCKDLPGVFDIKISGDQVWAACADGSLRCFNNQSMNEINNQVLTRDMLLSVDIWGEVAVTGSNTGSLFVSRGEETTRWNAHNSEIWWVKLKDGQCYTATDAGEVAIWDLETMHCMWKDSTTHSAGVCCVEMVDENTFVTSSYDKSIRMFDNRTRKSVWQAELGSGVWRVKKDGNNRLLCSAMHDGVHVMDLGTRAFMTHLQTQSIAYGSDSFNDLIASVTFYDNKLFFWSC